ncbi:MAG: M4 family metallopeptidase [Bacteroidota bacterium]
MKQLLITFTLIFTFASLSVSQVFYGKEAREVVPGSEIVKMRNYTQVPGFIKFRSGSEIEYDAFENWLERIFKVEENLGLKLLRYETDRLGDTHYRYQQIFKSIPVEGAVYIAHVKNGVVRSLNGTIFNSLDLNPNPAISKDQARNKALNYVDADMYKWQIPEEEQHLKSETNDPNATYYPRGELVFVPYKGNFSSADYLLAYKFDIYASEPLYRAYVFVDAVTGEVVFENKRIHIADVTGTAVTAYSGTQTITADSYSGYYRLREAGRGNGIETYDMNEGTNYGSAVDFTDGDNFWNNVNANLDQYATDAHLGAEMTYDYFYLEHGRNSIDGSGFMLRSYVHYDNSYANAFWDGQRMTYGDGSGSYGPFTALDITAHEIGHGLCEFTANLVYSYESGALNESFSDIWGNTIEYYGKPLQASWLVGEDIGVTLRSMSNPNAYGDPDTYLGTNWATGSADNGGVHTNSGVQNFWYYLLVNGGSGTNDNSDIYNVSGIGMTNASAIAFRNLTVYLSVNSQYSDARFYAIQSAIDLFGPCSPEVVATTDAWYAVGVGAAFDSTVTSDFFAALTSSCSVPFTVDFTNLSANAGSYFWDFGDGNTSTDANPGNTYNSYGTFTVKLISDGIPCGIDSVIKTAYIQVDSLLPCNVNMPLSGTGDIQTSCTGTLFDNGGPSGTYSDNTTGTITIAPTGATTVTLNVISFDVEEGDAGYCNYDYVEFFDGPNTSFPSFGRFCNTTGSPGTITSSGGSITILHYADPAVNGDGFQINWSCTLPSSPPVADFTSDVTSTCSGEVQFTDLSTNGPSLWFWDFGDGNNSTQQHPAHTYINSGTFTVKLIVTNGYGTDSLIQTSYITVSKPSAPNTTSASRCGPGSVTLSASGTGTLNWYDDSIAGNLVNTGLTFTTPSLSTTTDYYVDEITLSASQYVGPPDNTFGAGDNYQGDRHLVFDCYKPLKLVSVYVYAQGDGNRIIELRDNNGIVLQDITIYIMNGSGRITLDFDLPVGNDLQLGISGVPDLYRNSDGANFPYTLPGWISITGTNAPAGYYYFFYDWEVQEPCKSEMAQVTATINTEPVATITASTDVSCIGNCDGDATVAASSGTPSYTYSWSPSGQSTPVATGLCAGTHIADITDANGCTVTTSAIISEPAPITLSLSSVDATCGSPDGEVTVIASSGVTPYTYIWNDPSAQTGSTANGLLAGTYAVTVSDANGCSSVDSVIVNNSVPIVTISSSIDVTCNGGSDGQAVALATDGVPPYTYLWDDPASQTTVTATGLSAGTYTIYITDNNGCVATDVATINEPVAMTVSASVIDASCTGVCDGNATATASLGTAPYTYAWDDPASQTGITATGLCAGTYNVITTDVNGCNAATSATITELPGLTASITSLTNTTCGNCVGDATVTGTGGNTPYTYLWNDPSSQATATATGLCAGNYNVTVTDVVGCSGTSGITIFDFGGLFSSISATMDVSCNGGNDGQATASATGGGPPYTYQWDDPMAQTNLSATGLSAGTYTITVSDTNSCLSSSVVTINEPIAITLTTGVVDETCGNSDGEASVTVSGGVAPYSYLWDDPGSQTTSTVTGLYSNTYSVVITDANGCTANGIVTVNNLAPSVSISSSTDVSCYGGSDGSATLTASGGTPPYIYLWNDPGSQTTATATGLVSGTYTVSVTDTAGCVVDIIVTINEPPLITLTVSSIDASCGNADGEASAVASGGVAPYTYLWDDPGSQTTATASGLASGIYNIIFSDANSCSAGASISVNDAGAPVVTLSSSIDVSCNGGSDGEATVSVTGGVMPYTYLWDDPGSQTNSTATGLMAATYTVTVTDFSGCVATTVILINEPLPLTLAFSSINATCGNADGEASVTVSDGIAPYTYQWDDPGSQTTFSATGLYSGIYSVVITDANGCTANGMVAVNNIVPSVSISSSSDVSCNGGSDGEATVFATGGSPPYIYQWNDPGSQTTPTATGLGADTYTISVTDTTGCVANDFVTINEPPALILATSGEDANCGLAVGETTVSASGGTPPYNYLWNDPSLQTNLTATGLTAGTYFVTVADNNGCIAVDSVTISQSSALSIATGSVNSTCGIPDGIAYIDVLGGTPPYAYIWNDPALQTTDTATALYAGSYTVIVTDINGCTDSAIVSVNDAGSITVLIETSDVTCNGYSDGVAAASVTGGTPPFIYQWDDPASQTSWIAMGLSAGNYILSVTDGNGCTTTANTTINEPAAITTILTTNVSLPGACTGNATVLVNGGILPYTYQWFDPAQQTTQTATGLCPGYYTVMVTDGNGCWVTASDTVGPYTGIENPQGFQNPEGLGIYPNPTAGQLTFDIQLAETSDVQLEIYDVLGEVVHIKTFPKIKNIYYESNLKNLPNGVYLVKLQSSEEIINRKIIITK